jgi:hypothetical protein
MPRRALGVFSNRRGADNALLVLFSASARSRRERVHPIKYEINEQKGSAARGSS